MKALHQAKGMNLHIAKSWKRTAALLPRLIVGGLALIASFYLIGGIGMIIYTGKNSPEVQQSISKMEPGTVRTIVDFIL